MNFSSRNIPEIELGPWLPSESREMVVRLIRQGYREENPTFISLDGNDLKDWKPTGTGKFLVRAIINTYGEQKDAKRIKNTNGVLKLIFDVRNNNLEYKESFIIFIRQDIIRAIRNAVEQLGFMKYFRHFPYKKLQEIFWEPIYLLAVPDSYAAMSESGDQGDFDTSTAQVVFDESIVQVMAEGLRDVSPSHVRILLLLPDEPTQATVISGVMGAKYSTVHYALTRLEKKGFVKSFGAKKSKRYEPVTFIHYLRSNALENALLERLKEISNKKGWDEIMPNMEENRKTPPDGHPEPDFIHGGLKIEQRLLSDRINLTELSPMEIEDKQMGRDVGRKGEIDKINWFIITGKHHTALDLIEYQLERTSALIPRARLFLLRAEIYQRREEWEASERDVKVALEIAKKENEKELLVSALLLFGLAVQKRGKYDEALKAYNEVLRLSQEMLDEKGVLSRRAAALGNIGLIYSDKGDWNNAMNYLKDALKIHMEIDNKIGEANQRGNIGLAYMGKGDLDNALMYLKDTLKKVQEIDYKEGEATALGNIGRIYIKKGDLDNALMYFKDALKVLDKFNLVSGRDVFQNAIDSIIIKMDLHTHTTASDGSFSPFELINRAKKENIKILSITDHDTIEGLLNIPTMKDLTFVTGVEISAEYPTTLHILGYGMDINNNEFKRTLEELQDFRSQRNEIMVKKINEFGFEITINEIKVLAGKDNVIGRPHIAELFVRKGYVNSIKEAFEKYLGNDSELYVKKKRLSPEKTIELIKNAGGIPVLAHPYQTKKTGDDLDMLVRDLKSYGLEGIEVFYSKHSKEQIEEYLLLSKKYNLIVTGGSDFHGTRKPDICLGIEMPVEYVKSFLDAVKSKK